jgi:hypothetical protein
MMSVSRITPAPSTSLSPVYERTADRTTPAGLLRVPFQTTGTTS